jgi:putative flippase GtrA
MEGRHSGARLHRQVQRLQATALKSLLRYFVVGACAASVDMLFFLIFSTALGFHYLVVGAVGFIVATLVNYILCIRWIFESGRRFGRRAEIASVYAVSTVGLALHMLVLWLGVTSFRLAEPLAKVVAIGLVFFWNYAARRYYVFQPRG